MEGGFINEQFSENKSLQPCRDLAGVYVLYCALNFINPKTFS